MKKQTILAIGLVGSLALLGGCIGRLVSEGVGAATGASGAAIVLQEVAGGPVSHPLGVYERFELSVSDDMLGQAPGGLLAGLPATFAATLAAKGVPNAAAGKALLIRVRVLHYETSGLFGQLFGPLEETVARVEFVDADTKKVIAAANCVGRTKESNTMGVTKKTEGLAKGIVDWIVKRYPENQRVRSER
jgi:hypothetical protein